jgi:FtsP/CotA-like multicopper oxidase with cupredoxin domain
MASPLDPFRPPTAEEAWTRRDLMRGGMGSFALLCTIGNTSLLGRPKVVTSARKRSQAAAPFAPFQRDLPIMPELVPVRRTKDADFYEVAIRQGMADVLPGYQTPIYGYEGVYPGPTIRARKGRTAVVKQTNTLSFDSNVHLHGGYVPAEFDGHPMDVIPPGASFEYRYPNDQDGAYLWYHDHAHGRTARTLYYGLVGTYVLHDDREEELGLPVGEYDVPLVIQDHAFNKDGSFRYAENVDVGFFGDTILVNGAIAPRMAVERRKYRFRILNASNARGYRLVLGGGREMIQVASDGGLLEKPVRRKEIPIFPAERVEVVIDFGKFTPGTQLVLRNEGGEASTTAVMRFDVGRGGGAEEFRVPKRLRRLPELPEPNATRRLDLALQSSSTVQWQINGLGFDPARVDIRPRLGSSEIWQFTNPSNRVHPMHLHGMLFRIRERSTGVVHKADRGWKDTVAVQPGERVEVQPWFGPYAGRYVFHCHNLEHGDKAMMLQLEVVE